MLTLDSTAECTSDRPASGHTQDTTRCARSMGRGDTTTRGHAWQVASKTTCAQARAGFLRPYGDSPTRARVPTQKAPDERAHDARKVPPLADHIHCRSRTTQPQDRLAHSRPGAGEIANHNTHAHTHVTAVLSCSHPPLHALPRNTHAHALEEDKEPQASSSVASWSSSAIALNP